jgi:hypothetical protein
VPEDGENGRDRSASVHAGGDVIGVNVKGDKNVIDKNLNVLRQEQINQITISQQILSKPVGEMNRIPEYNKLVQNF